MHYTRWLDQNGHKGAKLHSSRDRGQPFSFTLGRGQAIAGWDQGVATMKTGGKRTLVIPPELGWRPRRRRGDPAQRDADLRGGTAGISLT